MKTIAVSIIVAGLIIGGALAFRGNGGVIPSVPANNVSIVNGIQIVEIRAKGGYQPRVSIAKAGLPTVLRFNTAGTFDCSASIRIPSLGISKILPQSGSTDIDLGSSTLGTLQGSCGMGMYPFQIDFKS